MALSCEPKKVWIEVVAIWVVAIGVIFLFKLLSFVPFIQENLWGIAGLVFLFLPIEWLYRKKEHPKNFGITWKHLGQGAMWAGILMVLGFPLYIPAYKWWFSEFMQVRGMSPEFHFALPGDFWKEVVGFVFLVAMPEEVFYRGYMQTRLDSIFKGRVRILGAQVGWALVITAAFFAVGHLVEPRPDKLGTFFPGLIFGWMRARTGSVGGAVIFHAGCNIWAQILRYGYFGA